MNKPTEIKRICHYCGSDFVAQKTTTKYCSHQCNQRHYKAIKRAEKIQNSDNEVKAIKEKPIADLKAKEFLSVKEVAVLIGCSRQNVYKLINTGKLKATNILQKKTIIRRSAIDKLIS